MVAPSKRRNRKVSEAPLALKPDAGMVPTPSSLTAPTSPAPLAAPPGLEDCVPKTMLAPKYVMPTMKPVASKGPEKEMLLAPQDPDQVEVFLQGLPKALCTAPCMQAMLEQAGLEKALISFRMRPGVGLNAGEAYISLRGLKAARRCLTHFNGRCWGAAPPVVATIPKVQEEVPPSLPPIDTSMDLMASAWASASAAASLGLLPPFPDLASMESAEVAQYLSYLTAFGLPSTPEASSRSITKRSSGSGSTAASSSFGESRDYKDKDFAGTDESTTGAASDSSDKEDLPSVPSWATLRA